MRLWVELGLAIGLTGLLRQVFLLFVPVLFLWLWWSLRPPAVGNQRSVAHGRQLVVGLATVSILVTLLIAPWTVRNHRVFGTLVPLNTNAGFAFYWGNHPIHGTRFMPLLEETDLGYGELIPREIRGLNEGAMDRALLARAMTIIRDDPGRYLQLSLSRSREYFKFWPSRDSGVISNVARVASFGVCLPLMIYGVALSVQRIRRSHDVVQAHGIVLLYLWVGFYAGIHLLTWTLIRYRLPVDVVLLMFAALGTVSVARYLQRSNAQITAG